MPQNETRNDLTSLFKNAQNGDRGAENRIADFFLPRALEIARKKFPVTPSPMIDHEDLAFSALRSLCMGIRRGSVEFRGDKELGGLLKDIVYKKSAKYWRSELTEKRNRQNITGEGELGSNGDSRIILAELAISSSDSVFLSDSAVELKPDEIEKFGEVLLHLELGIQGLFKELFSQLQEKPRRMLLLMLEKNLDNKQMAKELNCAVASVERYRASIKRKIGRITEGSAPE